jgi:hypothetical protein
MLETIVNAIKLRWKQFYNLLVEPSLSAEELKKLSWSKRVESYDAVPDSYKFFFQPLFAKGQELPYAILTPSFKGLLESRTTEKLVCALDNEIYVLEKVADSVKIYAYPLGDISCIEVSIVLLITQITICGITKGGLPESVVIKFNTATEELFTPILEKIRRVAIDFDDGEPSSEIGKFDYLEKLNYKFMNYARRSLLGGEKVLQIILQPRIRARVFKFLGKTFYRAISPAHLSILTNRELILIREEDNQKFLAEYGKVWDYIRLKKIVNMSLCGEDGNLLKLSIQLAEGNRIENLYQTSAKQEVNQLLSQFASITAGT